MVEEKLQAAPCATDKERERTVLFVCTGNTCRSPMAAALCNHNLKKRGYRAFSAGLYAIEGAPMTAAALDALAAAGVTSDEGNDYKEHRAHTVTRADMERADRVIGLSAAHAWELTMRFPDCAAKIECMPMDIADPYGGDAAVYRACLAEIGYSLALLFPNGEGDAPCT